MWFPGDSEGGVRSTPSAPTFAQASTHPSGSHVPTCSSPSKPRPPSLPSSPFPIPYALFLIPSTTSTIPGPHQGLHQILHTYFVRWSGLTSPACMLDHSSLITQYCQLTHIFYVLNNGSLGVTLARHFLVVFVICFCICLI